MDRKEVKKQVIKFYNQNKAKGKIFTVKHFEKKGESSSTVYNYLKDEPCTSSSSRTPFGDATNTTGNKAGKVVKKTSKKVLSTKPALVVPIQKSNFHNKSEQLLSNCRQRCGTLYEKFKNSDYVMDNICSFTYRSNQGSKYRSYWAHESDMRPAPVIYQSDLVPRLDVWIAISNEGISEPYICETGEIDTQVYAEEIVEAKLVPFINENHDDLEQTVLWSDSNKFGSKKSVTTILKNEDIQFVEKDDNPGNRVRCFSYFWTMLKDQVYRNNWIATNDTDLEKRIKKCLKQINMQDVIRLCNDTQDRIVEMYTKGVIEQFSNEKQNYTKSELIF